jgi:uncharacterized protein
VAGSARVALLDVNVLVALFDGDHIHHEAAHDGFADHREKGWAICPHTENGFVRVVSNPAYGLEPMRVGDVIARLTTFRSSGHRQLTDLYLLGLAVRMRGCLATFDRSISRTAVVGAAGALMVIGPEA